MVEVVVSDWVGFRCEIWIADGTIQLEIAVNQSWLSLYDDGGERSPRPYQPSACQVVGGNCLGAVSTLHDTRQLFAQRRNI